MREPVTEREETGRGGGRDQWRDQGVVDGRVEDDGRGDVGVPLREGCREFEDAVAVGSWFGRGMWGLAMGNAGGERATGGGGQQRTQQADPCARISRPTTRSGRWARATYILRAAPNISSSRYPCSSALSRRHRGLPPSRGNTIPQADSGAVRQTCSRWKGEALGCGEQSRSQCLR